MIPSSRPRPALRPFTMVAVVALLAIAAGLAVTWRRHVSPAPAAAPLAGAASSPRGQLRAAPPVFGLAPGEADPWAQARGSGQPGDFARALLAELAAAAPSPEGAVADFAAAAGLGPGPRSQLEASVDRYRAAMAELADRLEGGAGRDEGSRGEREQARAELLDSVATICGRALEEIDGLSPREQRPPGARLAYSAQLPAATRRSLQLLAALVP